MIKLKNASNIKAEQHPFHIVDATPIPIFFSFTLAVFLFHAVILSHIEYPFNTQGTLITDFFGASFHENIVMQFVCSLILLLLLFAFWGQKISDESLAGFHTKKIQNGLRLGFILFIISEVMFFFSIF